MKFWLVFYFLINGVWTPGDFAQPDGWTSIQYDSLAECEERRTCAQNNFLKNIDKNLAEQVKVHCQPQDPKVFWKRSVQRPLFNISTNEE